MATTPLAQPVPEVIQKRVKVEDLQVLYPCYIDSRRSLSEGRRIAKSKAIEEPQAEQMAEALKAMGFQCVLEMDKRHPQDWATPGRVRVLFKNEKNLVHELYKTKNQILEEVARRLPDLPSRKEWLAKKKAELERASKKQAKKEAKKEAKKAVPASASTGGQSKGGRKK